MSDSSAPPSPAVALAPGMIILVVLTGIVMATVFGIVPLPGPAVALVAAAQLATVGYLVVSVLEHPAGDVRLLGPPIFMGGSSFALLATFFMGLKLGDSTSIHGTDSAQIQAAYFGRHEGECNAWATSFYSGMSYCASPYAGWSNQSAYDAFIKVDTGPDPAFADFATKTPEAKMALLMEKGKAAYETNCAACHQATGQGVAGSFPPLAGDPVANGGSVEEHIGTILKGLQGKTINGVAYATAMTPFGHLRNEEIAAIATYERNAWGNAGGMVEPDQVQKVRGQ